MSADSKQKTRKSGLISPARRGKPNLPVHRLPKVRVGGWISCRNRRRNNSSWWVTHTHPIAVTPNGVYSNTLLPPPIACAQELSDALGMKYPFDNKPRSATDDGPRTLGDVKKIMEFLSRMDELVWRRSEHGADHGVCDPRNLSGMEERMRLWERIARGLGS
jgi:hypothetical protein